MREDLSPRVPMTDRELGWAITGLDLLEQGERERVLAELRRRGSVDHNGIRYSVGEDGAIRRGLPW
jgi:hypothetical protein